MVASRPLSIAVVGTSIPYGSGRPSQRSAAAFRALLEQFGIVTWFVLDLDGRQFASRVLMDWNVKIYPLAQTQSIEATTSFLPQARWAAEPSTAGLSGADDDVVYQGWMTRKRQARIGAAIRATDPDVLIIVDPVLVGLGGGWGKGAKRVLVDLGAAGLHDRLRQEARSTHQALWHGFLANALRRMFKSQVDSYAAVWGGANAPRTRQSMSVRAMPLPVLGQRDERLLKKGHAIVVPATGFEWLDAGLPAQIAGFLHALPRAGRNADVVLVGFDKGPAANLHPAIRFESDWRNFPFLVGQAACLFAPNLTPDVAEAIRDALAMGTPVVCPQSGARALGFERLTGVFSYSLDTDPETAFRFAIQNVRVDTAEADGIAAGAEAAFGPDVCAEALEAALSKLVGRSVERSAVVPLPRRRPRLSALAAPPKVLFNSATRLLTVELLLRSAVEVSEVQICDGRGEEITRFLIRGTPKRQHLTSVEEGVVLGLDQEPGDLVLNFYREGEFIGSVEVAGEQIGTVDAEFAALAVRGIFLEGVIWADDRQASGDWVLEHAAQRKRLPKATVRKPIGETGVTAFKFKTPLSRAASHGTHVKISRPEAGARALRQRPARLTNAILRSDSAPHVGELRDIHVGRRAWMLGNGPSVRLADLDAIPDGDVTFAFNRFYKSYDSTRLRENYVVSADTLMIADFGQEMIDISTGLAIFSEPTVTGGLHGEFVSLNPGQTYLPMFSYDLDRFVSIGGSSVFVALQLAYYMGIREVFLYGMDFSFNMKLTRDPRYPFPVSFDDNNHFIKGYRDAKPWCPPNWRDIATGFFNARVAFELGGGRIQNATRGGKLEIFERIDFEDAIKV